MEDCYVEGIIEGRGWMLPVAGSFVESLVKSGL
jgi:hypothetical protein